MLGKKVGIDLGATLTRVQVRGDPTISAEPSVVAVEQGPGGPRTLAVGRAAHQLAGRNGVTMRRAVDASAIVDRHALDALLQATLNRVCGRQRIFKPDVMVAVASVLSGVDRLQVLDACAEAGARTMYLIDRPLAAAIGSAMPVSSPSGRLIIEVGATAVEGAVIALEGVVAGFHLARGGAHLTAEISRMLGSVHGVSVGMDAAEDAKRELASAAPMPEERTLRVRASRAGESVEVVASSRDVDAALRGWLDELDRAVLAMIEETPAALVDDLRHRTGMMLSGGGALLRGLDRHLVTVTGLPTAVAREPQLAVARGTGTALESLDVVRRTFLYVR